MSRWEKYSSRIRALTNKVGVVYHYGMCKQLIAMFVCLLQEEGLSAIVELFPFTKYFSNAPQPLFKGRSFAEDWDIAEVSS